MYVKVSIPISSFKTFTYSIKKNTKLTLFLGQSVVVPFRQKLVDGFIVELDSKTPQFKGKILPIHSINDNSFPIKKELWKTIMWVSKYYICSIGNVLQTTLNYQHKKNYNYAIKKTIRITKLGKQAIENRRIKFTKQREVLTYIYINNNLEITTLKKIASSYIQICNRLQDLRYIQIVSHNKNNNFFTNNNFNTNNGLRLNNKQKKIYQSLTKSWDNKINKPALISGLPGSGKTIIYIHLIKSYIKLKKQIIVLVPEISLIPQTYHMLKEFFPNAVGTWYSKMTLSNRNFVLSELKKNKLSIIVATRSGVFFPFKNLGLIIVDEEQESSYKQNGRSPYYNARDVAIIRSQFNKNNIALISSTPSIESYYKYLKKDFLYYYLDERFYKSKLPKIKIINMNNKENYGKDFGMISRTLYSEINTALEKKQQSIILHNRLGEGIKKIEVRLKKLFPYNTIARYDSQSIKTDYFTIINNFQKQKIDILLGTQMLAKGINFKNVSLIGVINADLGHTIPDFRTEEKSFQLLYQFLGRASQNIKNSRAVIQTFSPDNKLIKNIYKYDIKGCYTTILNNRKDLFYPPHSRLVRILLTGKNISNLKLKSEQLTQLLNENNQIQVLGPSPAPIENIKNNWRYNILIKDNKKNWLKFFNWFNQNNGIQKIIKINTIKTKIDVDPNLFL